MNKLTIFNHPKFGEIRTLTENGETLFCGKDVAAALGYSEPHKAVSRHCRYGTKRPIGVQTGIKSDGSPATQRIELLFIPEGDIYRLTINSKLPGAEEFESWVFDEVIPSIRKTGSYSVEQPTQKNTSLREEAMLNNSRVRMAKAWLEICKMDDVPKEYKQICASYASEALAGKPVLPLPEVKERTYTAAEVGQMLGGISANKVGRLANQHNLKTPEFGIEVWDKSRHSNKEVASWRYNDKAVEALRGLLVEE